MDEAENLINDLEHKEAKHNQSEQQQEKRTPQKQRGQGELPVGECDQSHICFMGPEGEEKQQNTGSLFEKNERNFPNLVKEVDMQVQESQSLDQVGPKEDHTKTHHN